MAQAMAASGDSAKPASRGLHWFAMLTAAVAVGLIAAGATVTSTQSGDAVPDWPLSYGTLWPRMVGGVLIEHGHRLIAGFTALLITTLAVWLQLSAVPRWMKRLGWLAWGAVLLQAVLGGLRVLVVSHPGVQDTALSVTGAAHPEPVRVAFAVAHATLAQVVVCLTFALALFTAPAWQAGAASLPGAKVRSLRVAAALLVAALFLQLIVGAVMRHVGAGAAIPDFPLSFGHLIPPFTNLPPAAGGAFAPTYGEQQAQVAIHFAHRTFGILLGLAVLGLWWGVRRETPADASHSSPSPLLRTASALLVLVAIQVGLGALVVWTGLAVPITILHVATGASLLGVSVLFAVRAWQIEMGMEAAAE